MPTTSWTSAAPPVPDEQVHVVVTEFSLPRLRDTLPFLRSTRRITAPLREAEGLVGYALQARILRRTYRTVSAWQSPDQARRFARAGVHGQIAGAARAATSRRPWRAGTLPHPRRRRPGRTSRRRSRLPSRGAHCPRVRE